MTDRGGARADLRSRIDDLVEAIDVPGPTGLGAPGHRRPGMADKGRIDSGRTARTRRRRSDRSSRRSEPPRRSDRSSRRSEPPRRSDRRRRWPVLSGVAAAAALLMVVVAVFAGARLAPPPRPAEAGAAVLPAELPRYRPWRVPQSWSPLPAVAMTWRFHTDEELLFLDPARQALWGSDLSTVRYLTGEERPDSVVSPDGARLLSRAPDGVRVDDVPSGSSTLVDLPGAGPDAVTDALAWSTDSRLGYAQVRDRGVYEVGVDGEVRRIPGLTSVADLTPSPDGRALVVRAMDTAGSVTVVDRLTGETLTGPDSVPLADGVTGTPIWSLDSSSLLLMGGQRYTVVDVTSGEAQVVRTPGYSCDPLAMLSDRRVLCQSSAATAPGVPLSDVPQGLTVLDLDSDARTVVAKWPRPGMFIGAGVLFIDVADDLARSWRFSMDEPWYPSAEHSGL